MGDMHQPNLPTASSGASAGVRGNQLGLQGAGHSPGHRSISSTLQQAAVVMPAYSANSAVLTTAASLTAGAEMARFAKLALPAADHALRSVIPKPTFASAKPATAPFVKALGKLASAALPFV